MFALFYSGIIKILRGNFLRMVEVIQWKETTARKKILDPRKAFLKRWNVGFVLSCVIAVSLDPLFFYLPVTNEDKKCIRLDKKLWITAIILRSFFDIIHLLHIILQFRTGFIDKKLLKSGKSELNTDAWKIAQKYLWPWFLFDIITILPIPQVRETSANCCSLVWFDKCCLHIYIYFLII